MSAAPLSGGSRTPPNCSTFRPWPKCSAAHRATFTVSVTAGECRLPSSSAHWSAGLLSPFGRWIEARAAPLGPQCERGWPMTYGTAKPRAIPLPPMTTKPKANGSRPMRSPYWKLAVKCTCSVATGHCSARCCARLGGDRERPTTFGTL